MTEHGTNDPSVDSDRVQKKSHRDETDRVRRHTSTSINETISRKTRENVRRYASLGEEEMRKRIQELDYEWDVERVLETIAPTLTMTGLALGLVRDKRWFILPFAVMTFFVQHAVQGWCPPLPLLRRLGIRTRGEIDEEKYTLKAMRGDFAHMTTLQQQ